MSWDNMTGNEVTLERNDQILGRMYASGGAITSRGLLQKVPKIKDFCYLLGCSKKEEAKDCKKYDRFSC